MSEEIKKTAAVPKEKFPTAPQGQPVAAELKETDLDEITGGSEHKSIGLLSARRTNMSDEDVINAVRLRCRICNYLLISAMGWNAFWQILGFFAPHSYLFSGSAFGAAFVVVGLAMMTTAGAVSLAISRCPVCDHFLLRGRRKDQCGHCGAKVR